MRCARLAYYCCRCTVKSGAATPWAWGYSHFPERVRSGVKLHFLFTVRIFCRMTARATFCYFVLSPGQKVNDPPELGPRWYLGYVYYAELQVSKFVTVVKHLRKSSMILDDKVPSAPLSSTTHSSSSPPPKPRRTSTTGSHINLSFFIHSIYSIPTTMRSFVLLGLVSAAIFDASSGQ